MPIVIEFYCTVQFYRDHFDQLDIPRPRTCPHCEAVDSFIGHGFYWRKPLDRWADYLIRIRRWLCKSCRHTVSILPSFLLQRDESLDLDQPLNVHTLTTHLRQRGKTRRLLRQKPQTARRFERSHVNDLWQGDAMHGPWLPDPDRPGKKRRTHLFCFIDDPPALAGGARDSRLVPHAQFFFDEALPRMERVLKVGILRRGLPKAIYVDNGMVYSSTQFGAACASLGIQRIKAAPYSPQAKWKQERFFATLRAQFLPELETSDIATLADLNDALLAWIECIYHRHVHSSTQQTPHDRYAAGLDHVRPADAETLRLAFLRREKRKVRRNATIALQSNTYQVDPALAGQTVELRFDPVRRMAA